MEKNLKGKIKWYDPKLKGYGFLSDVNTKIDYFMHRNDVIDQDLIKDEIVTFDEKAGKIGICATNVKRLSYNQAVTDGKR